MKIPLFLTASLLSLALSAATAQPAAQPNPGQRQLIDRGYGMFIHFGVNTFNQLEWSDGKLPASSFNPTELDCDQWIRTAKEAGFRHVILVTKHHDGFCLWDSQFTDYDVASAPVKTPPAHHQCQRAAEHLSNHRGGRRQQKPPLKAGYTNNL